MDIPTKIRRLAEDCLANGDRPAAGVLLATAAVIEGDLIGELGHHVLRFALRVKNRARRRAEAN